MTWLSTDWTAPATATNNITYLRRVSFEKQGFTNTSRLQCVRAHVHVSVGVCVGVTLQLTHDCRDKRWLQACISSDAKTK